MRSFAKKGDMTLDLTKEPLSSQIIVFLNSPIRPTIP
jgi:hypothetical protein